jgi:hypothetical protein
MSNESPSLHGFTIEDLAAIADGLEAGYEKGVDVGGSPLDGSDTNMIESTTAAAARFIRAAIADPDAIRRMSIGCAALDDIISHSCNLQSAMAARIRLAVAEDREQVKAAGIAGEEFHGPTDDNESYWKRESQVLDRIIYQARFARGHQTS